MVNVLEYKPDEVIIVILEVPGHVPSDVVHKDRQETAGVPEDDAGETGEGRTVREQPTIKTLLLLGKMRNDR